MASITESKWIPWSSSRQFTTDRRVGAARWLTGCEVAAAQILQFGAGGSAEPSAPGMERYIDHLTFMGTPLSLTSAIQIPGWHPPFSKQDRDLLVLTLVRSTGHHISAFVEALLPASEDEP